MSECKHEKVYANFVLTSDPPQHPWICRKCGERGRDISKHSMNENEYDKLIRKFPRQPNDRATIIHDIKASCRPADKPRHKRKD